MAMRFADGSAHHRPRQFHEQAMAQDWATKQYRTAAPGSRWGRALSVRAGPTDRRCPTPPARRTTGRSGHPPPLGEQHGTVGDGDRPQRTGQAAPPPATGPAPAISPPAPPGGAWGRSHDARPLNGHRTAGGTPAARPLHGTRHSRSRTHYRYPENTLAGSLQSAQTSRMRKFDVTLRIATMTLRCRPGATPHGQWRDRPGLSILYIVRLAAQLLDCHTPHHAPGSIAGDTSGHPRIRESSGVHRTNVIDLRSRIGQGFVGL